jgi:hypothetical protein
MKAKTIIYIAAIIFVAVVFSYYPRAGHQRIPCVNNLK